MVGSLRGFLFGTIYGSLATWVLVYLMFRFEVFS